MPFIPLYIEELGAPASQINLFAGLSISITALSSAVVAPIWGSLADRKGRRLMMENSGQLKPIFLILMKMFTEKRQESIFTVLSARNESLLLRKN